MSAQATESFASLARRGSAVLHELQAQLEAELQALQQHDLEALGRSTEAKQQLLERFADLNRQRETLLRNLGVASSAAAVRSWLDSQPEASRTPADSAWQQLQQDLAEISRLNQRNEQVILRNSRNTGQLLNLLRGQSPTQSLYNPDGSKGPAASQHRLGKA